MDDKDETRHLKEQQSDRAETEQRLAREAEDEDEFVQHERRAEKAEYLRKKLEEREASEQE